MKRFVSMMLVALLAMSICVTAFAETFTTTLVCNSTEDSAYNYVASRSASTGKTGKVYVYHTVKTSGANQGYTNHFRIYVDGAANANNNKWVTPGTNTPIASSAITKTSTVSVKARGNTKYNDAGFSSISVSGSVGWPK